MIDLETHKEMAGYILDIFRTQPFIIMSWGLDTKSLRLSTDEAGNYGISFAVQGFKHKGKVKVLYDPGSDTFVLHLIDGSGAIIKTREDIFLDELVSVIDDAVEKVDNYQERVHQEYGIS